jgi:hypothetical protein
VSQSKLDEQLVYVKDLGKYAGVSRVVGRIAVGDRPWQPSCLLDDPSQSWVVASPQVAEPLMRSVAVGRSFVFVFRPIARAEVATTLAICTHLFDDNHAQTMAALVAISRPVSAPNVVALRRRT